MAVILLLSILSIYYPRLTGEVIRYEKEPAFVEEVKDGDTLVIDTEEREVVREAICPVGPRLLALTPKDSQLKIFTSDAQEPSKIIGNPDGTFVRIMKDKRRIVFDQNGLQWLE